MDSIKSNIEKVNGEIGFLITAMNNNIDSINTVSAISEEVVAGANQTYENTNNNGQVVKQVSDLAKELTNSINQLEQFMKE